MARTASEVINDLEKLLYELHELDGDKPAEAEDAMVVGVQFLLTFDIALILENGQHNGVSYAYNGNQNTTVTLGLANRAAAYADEQAYGVE